jgi:hypothetical protein
MIATAIAKWSLAVGIGQGQASAAFVVLDVSSQSSCHCCWPVNLRLAHGPQLSPRNIIPRPSALARNRRGCRRREAFLGNQAANDLLTREYRKPFVVPTEAEIG